MKGDAPRRILLSILLVLVCTMARGETIKVAASVPPLAWLAEQVGGERVAVVNVITSGQNPHTFEPTPRLMAEISDSRLFLTCGMPFEAKIQNKIASQNPNIVFVDTSKGVALQASECSHDATNDHDHEHGEKDPHIWLDPRNAIVMAENIRAALAPIDPDGQAACSTRTEALVERLTSLHKVLSERLAAYRGSSFYIYHPAFGYFAEAYGLKQVSVETEGKEPSARQLAELVDNAKRARIRVVFAQSQFSTRTAEMLARAIDGKVVILDDLAPDLITNLDAISTKFLEALAQGKAQ